MLRFVAMGKAVKEHLDALLGPSSKTPRERRAGDNRRVAPMVRDHEHGEPRADMRRKQVEQPIDLAFEAGRDVVD